MASEYTKLFENETYANILSRKLNNVSNKLDKREGSIVFDSLAPNAIEEALLYSYLDFLFKNSFGDTANRYWLIQRALERGISPYPSTSAIVVGKFNVDIGLDVRLHVDGLYFRTIRFVEEIDGLFYYELISEQRGTVGNIRSGKLTPSETIRGLIVSEIDRLAILGEDEEDTELFRSRYFETIKSNAYGGNIDDYRMKVKRIDGVGAVKVLPVWNGGGTVKIIITDPEFEIPSQELIAHVQEVLDPVPHQQKGVGVAPIGHLVTVEAAVKKEINITAKLMISGDVVEIKNDIEEQLSEYLDLQRINWETFTDENENLYVENDIRLTKVMSIILNTPNVIDYQEISFTDSEDKILLLEENELPFLGTLTIEEVSI